MQGYGEQAIFVLDRLSDEALRSINFQWGRPMPPQEVAEDEEEEIDEAELNLDKVEEEMAAEYSDEEEDEILHIDEFSAIMNNAGTNIGPNGVVGSVGNWASGSTASGILPQRPDEILKSNTDAEAWNLEVERVAPQLKVVFECPPLTHRFTINALTNSHEWEYERYPQVFCLYCNHYLTDFL